MKGSKYSLPGYLNAVRIRSSKTILVEGTTDQRLLNRLLVDTPHASKFTPIVDTSDIVDDDELKGLGARHRVLEIKQRAAQIRNLNSRLGTLIDREWNGLYDIPNKAAVPFSAPLQSANDFLTLGHSMENYSFIVDCACAYLKFRYPSPDSGVLEDQVRRNFEAILAFAAAYSIEMAHRALISRAGSLLTPDMIELASGNFRLTADASRAMTARNIGDVRALLTAVENLTDQIASSRDLQWYLHGHLGENAIWAAIGQIAALCGASRDVVLSIGSATSVERDRFWHDWLARNSNAERAPLDEVSSWATSAT